MSLQANDARKPIDTGKDHNQIDQKSDDEETRGKIRKMMQPLHGESLKQLFDFTYRLFTKS